MNSAVIADSLGSKHSKFKGSVLMLIHAISMNFLESSENVKPPFRAGPISGHYPCIWIINNFFWGRGVSSEGGQDFSTSSVGTTFSSVSAATSSVTSNCVLIISFIGSGFCSWIL